MNSQLSLNNSQLTDFDSQKRQVADNSAVTFDWRGVSEDELLLSDEEEESVFQDQPSDLAESSRNMQEELGKAFFVGAKFKSMEELREKAQELGSQFNCPITTSKSSTSRYVIMQCRHGSVRRKARKEEECESEAQAEETERMIWT